MRAMLYDVHGEDASQESLRDGFRKAGEDGLPFRGVPFWSWNGELEPEELKRQLRGMKAAGLGGFFMHGRDGLITPYLGERWMECVRASIEEAARLGMKPWLYDENGFPSGGAGGAVAEGGEQYQRTILECSEENAAAFTWRPRSVAAFLLERSGSVCRISRALSRGERPSAEGDGTAVLHFTSRVCGYVDVLSKEAIRRFIDLTYEKYWQDFGARFGTEIPGIFTDEPSYGLLPWSNALPDRFKSAKGYDIQEALPGLVLPLKGCEKSRLDYWGTVSEMFVEAYAEQIGAWCESHGVALTGHVAWAETLMGQMTYHASAMPFYEFMHIPGTNHLGVRLMDALREKQVASVARQMGDRRFLCEVAGGMGWGVSFEEVKWATEWQCVLGVNLLCQHLHHYTLHGGTKRDVPPSYSYQQPWWDEYKLLNDYFARLTWLLTRGKRTAETLVIHPIRSAWILFDGSDIAGGTDTHGGPKLVAYHDRQAEICNALLSVHRDFDYGDERIMARHGRVEGNRFIIGEAAYRVVLLPELLTIERTTLELLRTFMRNGGIVACLGEPPRLLEGVPSTEPALALSKAKKVTVPRWPSDYRKPGRFEQPRTWIGTREALKEGLSRLSPASLEVLSQDGTEVEHIWCLERTLDDGRRILFLVNYSREKRIDATVRIAGKGVVEQWDPGSAEIQALSCRKAAGSLALSLSFEPMQSRLLLVDPSRATPAAAPAAPAPRRLVELSGPWSPQLRDFNSLTVDWCRYAVDGGTLSAPIPAVKARQEIFRYLETHAGGHCELTLEYSFSVDPDPAIDITGIQLVVETPHLFSITINGAAVDSRDSGWWHDIAFRRIPIGAMVRRAENVIRLRGKLTPRTEIESVYIIGDFGVRSAAPFQAGERRTVLSPGPFSLCARPALAQSMNLDNGTDLTSQGLWFYAGNVGLTQSFDLPGYGGGDAWLEIDPPDAVLVRALVNGKDAGTKAWRPFRFDLTGLLMPGRNLLTLELFGSCRNLLGPHHHWKGEVLYTGAAFGFTRSPDEDEPDVPENTWVDRYCFRRFGLDGSVRIRY